MNYELISWIQFATNKKYVYEFKSGEERYLNIFHNKFTMSMI